ncbi:MAG: aldo/keto reductase [Proteobacteria bacterium]|jgi:aryl-alcohol dehydrogenase-like predicted oxidoreductase|nr:aldo/keto reductase [Pseudomonadota bacterium]MDA1299002.1 aldo/keto reductase [Pseudomonadota bacterium]
MTFRRLGRTALQVGPLAVGTVNFGWLTTETDSFEIMSAAMDRGLNLIDTSDNYNAGKTETVIGHFIAKHGQRDRMVLATKCYSPPNDWGNPDPAKRTGEEAGPNQRGLSAKHIIEACNASLKRLQTDYIDLYQMHHVDRKAPFEEIWQAYEVLVSQGKIIYAGTSNYAGWQLAKACESARARHYLGPVSEQSIYSLINRTVELEVIPACRDYGLGFIPYSPVGGGLLAGPGRKDQSVRTAGPAGALSDRRRKQLDDYTALCQELGHAPADVAIAWVAANPDVTSPIIGPRTMAHLESAHGALDITLDDETMGRLDKLFPGPGGEAPEAYSWG